MVAAAAVGLLAGCAETPAPPRAGAPAIGATPIPGAPIQPGASANLPPGGATAPGSGSSTIIITGRIATVADGGRAITFEESAHGMSLVALTYNTAIVGPDGRPREAKDLQPGMVIQVEGGPSDSGAVVATRVRIVSGP